MNDIINNITFVVASIGESEYLEDLLDNLIQLRCKIVLVDNSTKGKLKKYNTKYKDIRYVHESRSGVSIARNKGAKNVQTDYIYFLDDDMIIADDFLDKISRTLFELQSADCIVGKVKAMIPKNLAIPKKYMYLVGEKNLGDYRKKLVKEYAGGCNMLMSKKAYNTAGGFDEDFGHKGNEVILNEDALFIDSLRKMKCLVYYDPNLEFKHYWSGTNNDLRYRVKIQGVSDRKLDVHTNYKRFILRLLKYKIMLLILRGKSKLTLKEEFDLLRYSSYVRI